MDFIHMLANLFQNGGQHPQAQPAPRLQEDDQPVNTASGSMPLSSIQPGQPWMNPQNGYSPTGANFQVPGFSPVNGAVNPVWQQQKGYSPYGIGAEGPRTRF